MRAIRFFSLEENKPDFSVPKAKKLPKISRLTGYISITGKLVFQAKTVAEIGSTQAMRIGSKAGKGKLTTLYLMPTDAQDASGFPLVAAAKRLTIDLAHILQKEEINFKTERYSFTLTPFTFQAGEQGFKLHLTFRKEKPKMPNMGKRRGRKPRSTTSL